MSSKSRPFPGAVAVPLRVPTAIEPPCPPTCPPSSPRLFPKYIVTGETMQAVSPCAAIELIDRLKEDKDERGGTKWGFRWIDAKTVLMIWRKSGNPSGDFGLILQEILGWPDHEVVLQRVYCEKRTLV
ncbi:uncharacterized protein PV09_09469 [Verruconis gallopava]|uniref:Uncharacterized protein n=1 Tax=Verruconis gallopava TaxID=253628 RepID=A0A0D1ZWA1_9PEZI|nr:uncharacterized protein PV09_09469 [Verruconis gallopava]KIV98772.1 hypothetical protein PV09_09469 [Verruconis gallopava]